MRFAYAESFHATISALSRAEGVRLLRAVAKFEASWETGRFPKGLGMKHLKEEFFEFRADIHKRVLYQRHAGAIFYLLYGGHDDVQRFLKSV